MIRRITNRRIPTCFHPALLAASLVITFAFAQAADSPRVTGSYELLQKAELGNQVRIRIKLQFVDHVADALHVARLTFADFTRTGDASQRVSLIVRAHTSAVTTQEFNIPRQEYELWQRGSRPRIILELEPVNGRRATEVVRLERASAERGN